MKRKLSCLLLLFGTLQMYAQNLVPNPSFEEYSECPTFDGQLHLADGWTININTADYYNSCDTVLFLVSVPSNTLGFQNPVTGNAYAGFIGKGANLSGQEAREYMGVKLSSSLIIGEEYFVSFFVNLSDGSECGINKIGALFTNVFWGDTITLPTPLINNFAQVYTESIVVDTQNWFHISGSFVADSVYQYMLIGVFFDSSYISTSGNECIPYYFVDDVCVSTDSSLCNFYSGIANNSIISSTAVYPNPTKGTLCLKSEEDCIVKIYTMDGSKLVEFVKPHYDSTIDISALTDGIYLIDMFTKGQKITSKIILIH